MPSQLFVANWKMQKTFLESIEYCNANINVLTKLGETPGAEIVICPTFPALHALTALLAQSRIRLGGQTVSAHSSGAYTGQVSAQTLKEVGCSYCIVGHSEQREYNGVTNQDVAHAAKNLCDSGIEPIICIGETLKQFQKNEAIATLEAQLDLVLAAIKNKQQPITIAYEPVWAIGTGIVPEIVYLEKIFQHLATLLSATHAGPWRLIYGGSVSTQTITSFKTIPTLSGFLIGSASLDFQNFEKIVSLRKIGAL